MSPLIVNTFFAIFDTFWRGKTMKNKRYFQLQINLQRLRSYWEEQWIPQRVPWSCCGGLGAQWFVATKHVPSPISRSQKLFWTQCSMLVHVGPTFNTGRAHLWWDVPILGLHQGSNGRSLMPTSKKIPTWWTDWCGSQSTFLMEKPKLFLWEWIWGMFLGPGLIISTLFSPEIS